MHPSREPCREKDSKDLVMVSVAVTGETTNDKLSQEQSSKDGKEVTHVQGHDSQHAIDGQYSI